MDLHLDIEVILITWAVTFKSETKWRKQTSAMCAAIGSDDVPVTIIANGDISSNYMQ